MFSLVDLVNAVLWSDNLTGGDIHMYDGGVAIFKSLHRSWPLLG